MVKSKYTAAVIFGLSLILSAGRTLLITNTMEMNTAGSDTYFMPDGHWAVNLFTLTAVLVCCYAVFSAVAYGKGKHALYEVKELAGISALLLGVLLVGAALVYVFSTPAQKAAGGNMQNIIVFLSVCSAVVFLIIGLKSNLQSLKKSTVAGIMLIPVVLYALRVLNAFMLSSATPMASSGGYHILGLCAAMIYFICEGKSYIMNGSAVFCYLFGYLTVILLMLYSLPDVLLSCFGVFSFDYFSAFSVVDLCVALYITLRLLTCNLEPLSKETK